MGRQNKDGGMVGSSIVLLQERFKELQRLKEMREERKQQPLVVNNNNKLLVLADHHHCSRGDDDDHVYINCEDHHHDQAAAFKDPLALELNSSNNHVQYVRPHQDHEFLPPPANKVAALHSFYEKRDVVDTSLRL